MQFDDRANATERLPLRNPGTQESNRFPGFLVSSGSGLREQGAILLVSCYDLGHQPVALASPMAFLERAGFLPDAMDLAVEPFDEERAARALLVAISVPMHTALRIGVRAAAGARAAASGAHVCMYGLYAALNGDHLLDRGVADSVIAGEFEGPLVALAEALEAGAGGPVPGVRRRGEAARGANLARLDFPVPSRAKLPPLERYARLEEGDGATRLAGYVEASRGCLHLCRHCPIPPVYGGRFFAVPEDVVLADVRAQVAAGATHVTFGDPDFLNGPTHAHRIARALHAEFPRLTFDFTAKIEHLLRRRALLGEFAAAGCIFVVSALESLSDEVLRALEKGHTRADAIEALGALRDAGIALRPSFVPFTPWETIEGYLDLLDFVEEEGLVRNVDPVQYAIRLLVPPGSALLASERMKPHLGALDEERFMHRWAHPDPRMDALYRAVSRRVESGAARSEDAAETFAAIRDLAREAAGMNERSFGDVAQVKVHARSPRLTESWFC